MLLVCIGYFSNASVCEMKKYGPPAEKKIGGCFKSTCIEASDSYQVCKCVTEETTHDGFLLYHGNTLLGKWPSSTFMGDDANYEVMTKDLDGDGTDELIVANWTGTSNGMAVNFWHIAIIRPQAKFTSPLTFDLSDCGKGTFLKVPASDKCNIVSTEWTEAKSPKGRFGLYFVGRMFRYSKGRLSPVGNTPLYTRRYLESFAVERGKTITEDAQGAPLLWLSNSKTGARQTDPFFDKYSDNAGEDVDATIVDIETKKDALNHRPSRSLKILTDTGKTILIDLYGPSTGIERSKRIDRIGDAKSKRLYPSGYEPEDIVRSFLNKKIRLSMYQDEYKYMYTILWLK